MTRFLAFLFAGLSSLIVFLSSVVPASAEEVSYSTVGISYDNQEEVLYDLSGSVPLSGSTINPTVNLASFKLQTANGITYRFLGNSLVYYKGFVTTSSFQRLYIPYDLPTAVQSGYAVYLDSSTEYIRMTVSTNTIENIESIDFSGQLTFPFRISRYTASMDKVDIFKTNPSMVQVIIVTDNGTVSRSVSSTDGVFDLSKASVDFLSNVTVTAVYIDFYFTGLRTSQNMITQENYGLYSEFLLGGTPSFSTSPDVSGDVATISNTLSDIAQMLHEAFGADTGTILKLLQQIYAKTANIDTTLQSAVSILSTLSNQLSTLNTTASSIRSYMTTMLNMIVSTIEEESGNIQTAIAQAEQKLEDFLNETFGEAAGTLEEDSQGLSDSIGSLDNQEQSHFDNMSTNFQNLNMSGFAFSTGFISAFQVCGNIFTQIWNALGDYKAVYLAPLFLAIALLLIGRISRTASHRSSSKNDDSG